MPEPFPNSLSADTDYFVVGSTARRSTVDGMRFGQAMQRLAALYWDARHNGGPDLELLAIRRLLSDAALADTNPDEDEFVVLHGEPSQPLRQPTMCCSCGRLSDRCICEV